MFKRINHHIALWDLKREADLFVMRDPGGILNSPLRRYLEGIHHLEFDQILGTCVDACFLPYLSDCGIDVSLHLFKRAGYGLPEPAMTGDASEQKKLKPSLNFREDHDLHRARLLVGNGCLRDEGERTVPLGHLTYEIQGVAVARRD